MLLFKSDKGTALAVDSRLHKTPCTDQNTFINCLGGFAGDNYWSSTEFSGNPTNNAWNQNFNNGNQNDDNKNNNLRVRCVRGFKQSKVTIGVGF